MRSEKKFKKPHSPKASLSYKLTAYFVLFGLIIGYTVFIFSTAYSARQLLEQFSNAILSEIDLEQLSPENLNEGRFSEALQTLIMVTEKESLPIRDVSAYIEADQKWMKYSFFDRRIIAETVDINLNPNVLKAIEDDIAFSDNLFFSKSDNTTIFFNTPADSGHKIVLTASLNRAGIKELLRSQSLELGGFGFILIIFSFILGKLFSSSLTRPLKKLTANAVLIAEGDTSVSLYIKRRDEIGVLSRTLTQLNDSLNERLKAMEIMNRIDQAVLSSISRNDLLNRVIGFVCEYIDKSTVVMALRDDKGSGFELISVVKHSEAAILIDTPYIPDELLSRDTLKQLMKQCVFTHDSNLTEVLIRQLSLPKATKRFYNVPLYLQENYLGSLLIIKEDQQSFTDEQQQTLGKLGAQVGVAMQSVMAVEDNNSLQIGSIQALSHSIDAKSRWTAGHSERVAELSEMLGTAIGMEEMALRRLVISALLHDIGKIGISEYILDKPGRLTDEEFTIIKQHPDLGYDISRNIPNFEDICDGIRYHHERWNGSGYPMNLSGEEIPQFGRIIAIADVFDALSADRPYRAGMSFKDCIQFIEDKKGEDFDLKLAEVFIEAIKSPNNYLNNSSDGFKL